MDTALLAIVPICVVALIVLIVLIFKFCRTPKSTEDMKDVIDASVDNSHAMAQHKKHNKHATGDGIGEEHIDIERGNEIV